ncbi:MAG TPA: alpha/beta hydrolase [Acidimicrobiales bacterium]|nr:alpha/beta hydrolase [Acidimicrobiales bacterium]
MAQAAVNGITLEYEREGTGEPMLLIMGLGAQLTAWSPEFVELLVGRGFEVIRHDNRDAGLSTEMTGTPPSQRRAFTLRMLGRPVDASYLIGDMADDAAALLDDLEIESAHVVGVSMGGMIAQSLAIGHPERVRSLTSIMSNPGDGSGLISPKLALSMARRPTPTLDNAIDLAVDTSRRISGPHFDETVTRGRAVDAVARSFRPQGTVRQTAAIMASPNRVPGLQGLDTPTLVIHGLLDPLVRPSGGVRTAQAVPNSRLLMFNDMAHDLPAPRLGETADAIAQNASRVMSVRV